MRCERNRKQGRILDENRSGSNIRTGKQITTNEARKVSQLKRGGT